MFFVSVFFFYMSCVLISEYFINKFREFLFYEVDVALAGVFCCFFCEVVFCFSGSFFQFLFFDSLGWGGRYLMANVFHYVLAFFSLFLPEFFVFKVVPNLLASLIVFPVFLIVYRCFCFGFDSLCCFDED